MFDVPTARIRFAGNQVAVHDHGLNELMTVPSHSLPRLIFINRYFHPDQSATSRLLSDLAFALANAGP